MTEVLLVDSTGNRRSVGATIHCMHGSEAVIEGLAPDAVTVSP
ncbi:MAG: hypothetical protein ACXWWU_00995 [Candidatus Limnocylindria bacterium]